jgi:hypothetical protein
MSACQPCSSSVFHPFFFFLPFSQIVFAEREMGRFLKILGDTFLTEHLYGSKYFPNLGKYYFPFIYVKAMIYTAGADELSLKERQYIQGLAEILLPNNNAQAIENRLEIVSFVDTAIPNSEEHISSFLSGSMMTSPVLSRVLIYDVVRAAAADGEYSKQERENVHRVCKQLGITENIRKAIEEVSEREQQIATQKRDLLFRL